MINNAKRKNKNSSRRAPTELNDRISHTLEKVNMSELQNTKPVKLYTDGTTGILYSYIPKEEVIGFIKIAEDLILKEEDTMEREVSQALEKERESNANTTTETKGDIIISEENIKRIEEIATASPKIVTEEKEKRKNIIGCTECGKPIFLTKEQYAIVEHRGELECPHCHNILTIKTEKKTSKIPFIILRKASTLLGCSNLTP